MFHNLIRNIYVWLLGVAGGLFALGEVVRNINQSGALFNEAWFLHGVSETVHILAQQRRAVADGAFRLKTGVKGKTYPFNRLGALEMQPIVVRDAATQYLNPPQSKRRAQLYDFGAAILLDEFDEVRTLTDPLSEHSRALGYALARQRDRAVLAKTTAQVGGLFGTAEVVDEALETATATSFATDAAELTNSGAANSIVNGGAGLTMAKIRDSKRIMDDEDVPEEDQYFFYSPRGMAQLLSDPTASSADYSTIQALTKGGFGMDETWYGAMWRKSTMLPKAANIRSCCRVQKEAVGVAVGMVKEVEMGRDPSHWNNPFAMIKLSIGSVRVDPKGVVGVDIDESV